VSHDNDRVCECRSVHSPYPLELERHHIWPLGMGGPDTSDNVAWVCPTTHTNIHELLRHIVRVGMLTWGEVGAMYDVPVSRYAFDLAHEGYRRFIAGSVAR
jgi:hypothetical protein